MRLLSAVSLCLFLSLPAHAEQNPWVAITERDLQAIHDILRDNHPGPVDPENSRYKEWLGRGLAEAKKRAEAATSFADYQRALRFYTNGFQDGHIGIGVNYPAAEILWPGLVVAARADGAPEVTHAEENAGVNVGAKLISCDGQSIDVLLRERVDPYFWNTAIPHERSQNLFRLFYMDALDPMPRLRACAFSSGDVTLKWHREDRAEFVEHLEGWLGQHRPQAGIKRIGSVWLISIPSLATGNEENTKKLRAVIAETSKHSAELRKATVVVDVRDNHGGDSSWGEEFAAVLWGKDWVRWVTDSFDNTVDWRASRSNLEFMRIMMERERKAGLAVGIAETTAAVEAMSAALDAGRPLARVEERPKPRTGTEPPNPVTGHVYFFTDGECASACLDFADLMRRLPRVTHVGLPTSADAIYIDNTYTDLPSELAGLGYSMKVFRNRVRGNNEWYEPTIRWPGGPITDETIVKWVASLPN